MVLPAATVLRPHILRSSEMLPTSAGRWPLESFAHLAEFRATASSGTVYQDSDTSNACCEKSLLPGGSSPYKVCCDASKIAGAGTTASPYVCCTTSTFTDTNGKRPVAHILASLKSGYCIAGVKQCCPIGTTPAASVAGGAKDKCCQNGALYYPDGTSNSATCCSSGNLVPNIGDGSLPTICCKSTQIAVG